MVPTETKSTRWILAGVLLTLAVVAGREALPQRTLELTAPQTRHYLSSPADPAMADRVEWVDEQRLHFRCRYHTEDGFSYRPCSLSFVLTAPGDDAKGMDLSRYRAVRLDVSYKGTSEFLRLSTRTFDPRFSRLSDANSARMQSINLRARDIVKPVTIGLSELTVPEWWTTTYNLPREFTIARLDNVVSVTIDLPADIRGATQEIEVHHVALQGEWVGRDTLYLVVLSTWVVAALAIVIRRAAHLRSAHDRLRRLVHLDPLTGLLNRRGGEERIAELVRDQRPFALFVVDLDHFKRINDTHGHVAGDEVLRRSAKVISDAVRSGDIVARWGGEEFLVVCIDCPEDQATRIAQKVRRKLEASSFGNGRRIAVTASIGVTAARPGEGFVESFARADAALYCAKRSGRNRVVLDGEPAATQTHA